MTPPNVGQCPRCGSTERDVRLTAEPYPFQFDCTDKWHDASPEAVYTGMGDSNNQHIASPECGFDRDGSASADTYVCRCGWSDTPPPEQGATVRRYEPHADDCGCMLETTRGGFVDYADYAAVVAERDAFKRMDAESIGHLKQAIERWHEQKTRAETAEAELEAAKEQIDALIVACDAEGEGHNETWEETKKLRAALQAAESSLAQQGEKVRRETIEKCAAICSDMANSMPGKKSGSPRNQAGVVAMKLYHAIRALAQPQREGE